MDKNSNQHNRHLLHPPRRLSVATILLTIALSSCKASQIDPLVKVPLDQDERNQSTTQTSVSLEATQTYAVSAQQQHQQHQQHLQQQQQSKSLDQYVKALPSCLLGNDTYQLGERWNPNLPPFGVQVCVQCECIIRQRKNCYEAKVTCRRITNECPIIDSCPDGKRPVTTAGQCCKSCQSTTNVETTLPDLTASRPTTFYQTSSSSSSSSEQYSILSLPPSQDRLQVYKNERIKEYQSVIKNLEACEKRDATDRQPNQNQPFAKTHKNNKNDLNGIDSKLAFKSLRDSQNNYLTVSNKNRDSSRIEPKPVDDSLHQHPNDVQTSSAVSGQTSNVGQDQSISLSNNIFPYNSSSKAAATVAATATTAAQSPNPIERPPGQPVDACLLGSEIYQIGQKWSPTLPPFGVQVCVQCNCVVTLKQRKACYEPKVTCRRINSECPNVEFCPDGKRPISITGECCKTCPGNEQVTTPVIASERAPKSGRAIREYQIITKNYPPCQRQKDIEIVKPNTNNTLTANTTVATSINTSSRVKKRSQ